MNKNKIVNIIGSLILVSIILATIIIIANIKNNKSSDDYNWNSYLATPSEIIEYKGESYKLNGSARNYLIVGIDTRNQVSDNYLFRQGGQADFIFLVSIDYENGTKQILQLNRDTMTDIDSYTVSGSLLGTTHEQLALAYAYGTGGLSSVQNIAKAVSKMLGNIQIHSYYVINMNSIVTIIDELGGISITLSEDLLELGDIYYNGNTITLNGEEALSYVRARMNVSDGTNISRMRRHREFLACLLNKISDLDSIEGFVLDLREKLKGDYLSNLTTNTTIDLFSRNKNIDMSSIKTIDGESSYENIYAEFYLDEASTKKTILDMFYKKITE